MNSFSTLLAGFRKDSRGNIAIMFGALIFLVVGAAGAAIDFMRIERARTVLAEAGDAALLAAARYKGANPDATDDQLTAISKKLFDDALKDESEIKVAAFKIAFNDGASTFRLNIDADLDLLIMDIAGFDKQALNTTAEAKLGKPPYIELAMALDVTGSMNSNGRLKTLKVAAKDLVESLFSNDAADVKIGIAPFAQYVNIGTKHGSEPWFSNPGAGWAGCVGSRTHPFDVEDGNYNSYKVPGIPGSACPPQILPLTDDKAKLTNMIDDLSASGWTYIPSGTMWAWSLLSPQEPFTEAVAYEALKDLNGTKALLIMTDGDNTRAPDYPTHNSTSKVLANDLTRELCSNIKAEKITVYTVAFEVTDTTIKDILRDCATNPSLYFDAKNSKTLTAAFASIAASLRNISLSR
jgi:Flp pilus assembly protein TadG